ncbi:hypothetical protein ACFWBC_08950 [Streptomyces sp. NPDC059985]|uniref:hypothetical protein n=1 Tax=Streptomyces sp. NPDC059985 TaxID=3347025 RepID=UPI003676EC45
MNTPVFRDRQGPAEQAVPVKRMESGAQPQPAALGATYPLVGQVMASTRGRQVPPMGRYPAPEGHPGA